MGTTGTIAREPGVGPHHLGTADSFRTSHVWEPDRNGFNHQDPGFLDPVVDQKATARRHILEHGENPVDIRDRTGDRP